MILSYTAIIPAYNASETLERCLKALQNATPPPLQIIVSDDGSTDSTPQIAQSFNVDLIQNDQGPSGPAHARNAAVDKSASDLILFVDADVEIALDAPQRLFEEIETHPSIVAAFGSYGAKQDAQNQTAYYANLRHHFFHQNGEREAETFWTGVGAITRPAFDAVNGFTKVPGRLTLEDVNLGYRLRQAGYRIRLVPDAQGTHLKNWTLKQLWHDDIFARAVPWSNMIVNNQVKESLNVSPKEKITALLAHLIWSFLIISLIDTKFLYTALGSAIAYIYVNLPLIRLIHKHTGLKSALTSIGLHWTYHLYSSVTFAVILIKSKIFSQSNEQN